MGAHLLHDLVAASAQRDPGAEAVVDGERSITYAELDERSSRLSGLLAAAGVRRGDRVGVHAEKSIEALVALYGAMKAGAAYVPLDPAAPAARTGYIAGDCGIRVLATPTTLARTWAPLVEAGAPLEHIVALDAGGRGAADLPVPPGAMLHTGDELDVHPPRPAARTIDDDLAYILYTSGSTGSPKGVMVSHRNAMAFAAWAAGEFRLRSADRVAQLAPLIFDLSTFDLFSSACTGSAVHLVGRKAAMFPAQLRSFIDARRITVVYAVPSLLTMLVERGGVTNGSLASLRLVLFAGEVFPTRHLAALMRLVPGAEYANLYGPTETNVCTFHRVTRVPDDGDPPTSIGIAIAGDETIVVGDDGEVVAPGETGELYVRGATVMQGYWGDPERSARTLVAPPGVSGPREPAYRTGDLVREEADGTLTFLGRRDNQIKRQGYRIELGDIEATILQHPDVVECAVTALPDEASGARLIAHVAAKNDLGPKDVVRFCTERIPRYMVPDKVDLLDDLPKTATAKIDRAGLARRARETAGDIAR
ncbi:MAG TPA: amino acid adenylation domain-containing protein [Acidimicrobiales bacterium]